MSCSILSGLASQWFDQYARLAYWLARRVCRRALLARGREYSANDVEELAQDAVCRAFARFAKRCQREVCGASDRKRWVCQCVVYGAREAIRSKSTFGSITEAATVRDDAMNRCQRVATGFVHGNDDERLDALALTEAKPVEHVVQRWELELLISSELPNDLQPTALYAACGLTQEQSAILQGVTDRTVRSRLSKIRQHLCPSINPYAVICAALLACMDKPQSNDTPTLAPVLADALAS